MDLTRCPCKFKQSVTNEKIPESMDHKAKKS